MKPIEVAYWEEDPTGSVKRDSPLLGDLALELSFAHPGLVDAHLLKHLKVFAGRFYSLTESVEQPCAPLVVYTLQKLMSEEFALCLSITGKDQPLQQTESGSRSAWMVPLANWLVDHELMHRRLWYSALVLPNSRRKYCVP